MGKQHIVVQGEYLSMIASTNGFASYKTIWDAPENKELKEKRKNPNVLFPGDELFIPDKEIKEESRGTEKRHTFQLDGEPLKLRIVLVGLDKKPLQGHECELIVESDAKKFTTGSDGKHQEEISEKTVSAKLLDKGKPGSKFRIEREIPLKVGHLDPVDEMSGQMARLNNLGYNAGDEDAPPRKSDEDKERFNQLQSAIEEFQCDFDLRVDGDCGKKTRAKLLDIHGC